MEYEKLQKIKVGAGVTGLVGALAGAGVAVWGGYEIGTAVNNYIGLTGTGGRAVIDLVVMGVAAGPCIGLGFWTGAIVGGLAGAATHTNKK